MEFSDIDPSQFLDQMNWESQDNADNDNDNRRASNGDNASEDISCDLENIKHEQDDERENWRWESVLFGMEDQRDGETAIDVSNGGVGGDSNCNVGGDESGVGDLSAATQEQGYASLYSFPPMASYESMMLSSTQNHHQQAQPNLLRHPLAMTSLSSCPPHVNGTFSRTGAAAHDATNGDVIDANVYPQQSSGSSNGSQNGEISIDDDSGGNRGFSSSLLQSSMVSRSSMSHAVSCQNGSSQASSGNNSSNDNSSSSRTTTDSTRHPFLPSWNDSMGDLMYSSLFNIGIPNTTTNNLDGTTVNPFQFTPLNSAFEASPTDNLMTINQHYGMAINGFHPQVNASVNPVLPLNGMPAQGASSTGTSGYASRAGTASPGTVKTSNAGKSTSGNAPPLSIYNQQPPGHQASPSHPQQQQQSFPQPTWLYSSQKQQQQELKKAAKERNEREQIRAKKITQLIDELRDNMQKDGWKEEMKSKYETLSQCKAYMEHLKRSHKEKENDIEHTKKLIEEKALLEARSDPESIPESITSSLTASSGRRSTSPEESGSDKEWSSSENNQSQLQQQIRKKRKTLSHAADNSNNVSTSPGNSNKKLRTTLEKRKSPTSTDSSSEDDAGNEGEGPGGKKISFDKTSSSVSDMTDSNRSSIDGTGTSKSKQGKPQAHVKNEIGTASVSTSSISSTAAVVRGSSHKSPQSNGHNLHRHQGQTATTTELIAEGIGEKENEKKPHKKRRRGFEYDYKEVFTKSNLPQLIATLSGRVVVWNEFFLLATGLSEREAKSLSIFSIVDSGQLTDLYKFVARALAENRVSIPSAPVAASPARRSASSQPQEGMVKDPEPTSEITASDKTLRMESWQAITLKCIRFASKQNKEEATYPNPLYLTVALMFDEDRDQRCFHCIITDCPGTNGAFGRVTPELLAMLFTPNEKEKFKDVGE
eukprot:CCRYP_021123-RA/>CCRYP_021123-RA protein AED:0.03 eAED:0.03 QI:358/1/1/1/1/1/3/324/932